MSDQQSEKILTARGTIVESLPATLFKVKIPACKALPSEEAGRGSADKNEKEILAYLSGKMRMHRIKVLVGDTVEVVLDSYGGKGRIVKRL